MITPEGVILGITQPVAPTPPVDVRNNFDKIVSKIEDPLSEKIVTFFLAIAYIIAKPFIKLAQNIYQKAYRKYEVKFTEYREQMDLKLDAIRFKENVIKLIESHKKTPKQEMINEFKQLSFDLEGYLSEKVLDKGKFGELKIRLIQIDKTYQSELKRQAEARIGLGNTFIVTKENAGLSHHVVALKGVVKRFRDYVNTGNLDSLYLEVLNAELKVELSKAISAR